MTTLTAGFRFTMPASHTYGAFEAELEECAGERLGIKRFGSDYGPLAKIERHRFSQFIDDLNGRVDGTPDSDDPSVNAVLSGDAIFLGRGNDGLAFDTRDGNVVKVASDTPFHWNNGLKDEGDGNLAAIKAVEINDMLRANGVPCLLAQRIVEHNGRVFTVMPKLDVDSPLTVDHINQLSIAIKAMHALGYVVGDQVQAGLADDVYIYDIGSFRRLREGCDWDVQNDESSLSQLAKKHGVDFVALNPVADYDQLVGVVLKFIARWNDGGPRGTSDAFRAKLIRLYGAMDSDMQEFYADGHADTIASLDRHAP